MVAMVFVTTEILIYGFSTWVIDYYLIWPMLVLIVSALSKGSALNMAMPRQELYLAFSTECFCHNQILFYGPAYGLAYWINRLTFDLVHGVSNFIIILLLYKR